MSKKNKNKNKNKSKSKTYGAGTATCEQYLKISKDEAKKELFLSWAQGFISGLNLTNNADLLGEFGNSEILTAWLEQYCKKNPLEQFDAAVFRYISFAIEERAAT